MKEVYTEREAAGYLGVHRGTLANWRAHKKNLSFSKQGKFVRYLKSDLDEFLQRTKVKYCCFE